jgi:hypothetical protein
MSAARSTADLSRRHGIPIKEVCRNRELSDAQIFEGVITPWFARRVNRHTTWPTPQAGAACRWTACSAAMRSAKVLRKRAAPASSSRPIWGVAGFFMPR